jgi:hypothetical protein
MSFRDVNMTNDIAALLTSRRAEIAPEQAGLPTHGTRRVPGLRREEVASLAGVSIDYYKGPVGPRRGAVDPQRRVPHSLGRAQRALPPHWHQAAPSSDRQRPELE